MFCATFGDIGIVAKQFADCIVGILGNIFPQLFAFRQNCHLDKAPCSSYNKRW